MNIRNINTEFDKLYYQKDIKNESNKNNNMIIKLFGLLNILLIIFIIFILYVEKEKTFNQILEIIKKDTNKKMTPLNFSVKKKINGQNQNILEKMKF
jgi:hypothetical protein